MMWMTLYFFKVNSVLKLNNLKMIYFVISFIKRTCTLLFNVFMTYCIYYISVTKNVQTVLNKFNFPRALDDVAS